VTPNADLASAELVRLYEDGRSEVFGLDLEQILVQCDASADLELRKDDAARARSPTASSPRRCRSRARSAPRAPQPHVRTSSCPEVLKRAGGSPSTRSSPAPCSPGSRSPRTSSGERPLVFELQERLHDRVPMRAAPWLAGVMPGFRPAAG
jgi:hypothetical protein